ncbi:MAG: glycosyltransferase, partial [Muribaculaceae bacterium]|nr:glycosyltransferase [Muribaculaceae bacterium]
MLYYIFEFIDGIRDVLSVNFLGKGMITTFWFLLFIEFPRYYFTDFVVAIWHGVTFNSRRKKREAARYELYLEKPLVTILAPGKNEGKQIYKLVTSLSEQTYQNFEIIIVDDGSDDTTPQICRDLLKRGYIHKYFRMVE